jgi:subtilase family serine protease
MTQPPVAYPKTNQSATLPRLLSSMALLLFTAASLSQAPSASPKSRIHSPIDDADVVTLLGNTHPAAKPSLDLGAIQADTQLNRLVLLLQPDQAQQSQLDALSEAQQQPNSPVYHQWLTPQEFGARFGASPADIAQIATWLKSHGFEVEPYPASHLLLIFSGSEAQVEDTFHTEIHSYKGEGASTKLHLANSQDPQIPRALAPIVSGILSLHDFRRISQISGISPVVLPRAEAGPTPENTQSNAKHYLFPADFATIYDLNPLYNAGTSGKTVSIAIAGRSNINQSDVATFRLFSSLSTSPFPSVILDGPNPGLVPGDQDEATLDVEWSGAVAPAAQVKLVVAASTSTTDGADLSALYIVNHKTAPVMSTSFGNCESQMGATEMAFYKSLWQQAATEGVSVFVSSGDSGASGCDAGSAAKGTKAAVNGLCTSSFATCVGGTEFNEGSGKFWSVTNGPGGGSALGYIPEKVWNESASDYGSGLWSSGGGASIAYPQPGWQQEIAGANSNAMRAVPDVALTAALHDGYIVCENGNFYTFGGTSASSPAFAGIMALVVQKQGGVSQGSANPGLYSLLLAIANPFHSTPVGNNSVPGVFGFYAGAAPYNLASGLGSVDARLLVNQWPRNASGNIPGFRLIPSLPNLALISGNSAQFPVQVASLSGFSASVKLSATAPAGVTLTLSSQIVNPGHSVSITLRVASTAKPGKASITLTGASGPLTETVTLPLTILPSAPN